MVQYKSNHAWFTCKAQADMLKDLLQKIAPCPQDVSLGGRMMTTNAVEKFHGLALMYQDKRADLGHTHVFKTNMAFCHKVSRL